MPRRALMVLAVAIIAALLLAQIIWRSVMENNNWVRPALVALIAAFAFMLVPSFIVPAHSQTCETVEARIASLDKHTKKAKVGAKAYKWVYPADKNFTFVYVLFDNSTDVVLVMFQNNCLQINPLTGTWAAKIPMNEKVRANISEAELVFEANAPTPQSY